MLKEKAGCLSVPIRWSYITHFARKILMVCLLYWCVTWMQRAEKVYRAGYFPHWRDGINKKNPITPTNLPFQFKRLLRSKFLLKVAFSKKLTEVFFCKSLINFKKLQKSFTEMLPGKKITKARPLRTNRWKSSIFLMWEMLRWLTRTVDTIPHPGHSSGVLPIYTDNIQCHFCTRAVLK